MPCPRNVTPEQLPRDQRPIRSIAHGKFRRYRCSAKYGLYRTQKVMIGQEVDIGERFLRRESVLGDQLFIKILHTLLTHLPRMNLLFSRRWCCALIKCPQCLPFSDPSTFIVGTQEISVELKHFNLLNDRNLERSTIMKSSRPS